jgi:hypothetical protein
MRREYLFGVGVAAIEVDAPTGDEATGEEVCGEGSKKIGAEPSEFEGAREDAEENVPKVGRGERIAGDARDVAGGVDVLSQTSKLT